MVDVRCGTVTLINSAVSVTTSVVMSATRWLEVEMCELYELQELVVRCRVM